MRLGGADLRRGRGWAVRPQRVLAGRRLVAGELLVQVPHLALTLERAALLDHQGRRPDFPLAPARVGQPDTGLPLDVPSRLTPHTAPAPVDLDLHPGPFAEH